MIVSLNFFSGPPSKVDFVLFKNLCLQQRRVLKGT